MVASQWGSINKTDSRPAQGRCAIISIRACHTQKSQCAKKKCQASGAAMIQEGGFEVGESQQILIARHCEISFARNGNSRLIHQTSLNEVAGKEKCEWHGVWQVFGTCNSLLFSLCVRLHHCSSRSLHHPTALDAFKLDCGLCPASYGAKITVSANGFVSITYRDAAGTVAWT